MTIIKKIAHGTEVYADEEMDELRRKRCLCLKCKFMRSHKELNCPIAQKLFEISVQYDNAMMMTRCKSFKIK